MIEWFPNTNSCVRVKPKNVKKILFVIAVEEFIELRKFEMGGSKERKKERWIFEYQGDNHKYRCGLFDDFLNYFVLTFLYFSYTFNMCVSLSLYSPSPCRADVIYGCCLIRNSNSVLTYLFLVIFPYILLGLNLDFDICYSFNCSVDLKRKIRKKLERIVHVLWIMNGNFIRLVKNTFCGCVYDHWSHIPEFVFLSFLYTEKIPSQSKLSYYQPVCALS